MKARRAPWRRLCPLLLSVWWTATTAGTPARIASLNLCTDSMLFELVDDDRIVSVTALARDPGLSHHHRRALRLPINHGAVEEVLAARPDLVLVDAGRATLARHLLGRLDIPVLAFEHAEDFTVYADNLTRLGAALGRVARAADILARLRAGRARLSASPPADGARAIVYQPNGYTPGTGTLMHTVLGHAGLRDIAAELGIAQGAFLSLEELLLSRPQVLVLSARDLPTPALAEQMLHHPALRRLAANAHTTRVVTVPEATWTCAGLHTLDAIARLRADLAR